MDQPAPNRWIGKSADEVLAESYHELRDPIYSIAGFLQVIKSSSQLPPEEVEQYIGLALNYALYAQEIVNSVYQYMHERNKDR